MSASTIIAEPCHSMEATVPTASPLITLEFLQDLLKMDYPDVKITHFEGAPGSNRGDNYTSMVYRLTLRGTRRAAQCEIDATGEKGGDRPWTGSLIYKVLPDSAPLREAFRSDQLFCNEVAFYNKIWPALDQFQRARIPDPTILFQAVPRCYLARSNLVVLGDLCHSGFIMPDRRTGLSTDQCFFVLRQLAHFHAISLAMQIGHPMVFQDLVDVHKGIHEVYFAAENEKFFRSYYAEAAANAIAMVEFELNDLPGKELYLSKFRAFCAEESFFPRMVELASPAPAAPRYGPLAAPPYAHAPYTSPAAPLAVVTHGDAWTNNMLFRYHRGQIAEMCLVDFQLCRLASPALDVAYVVYVCLSHEQRRLHLPTLLARYADQLHARLMMLAPHQQRFRSRDHLHQILEGEMTRGALFALGTALDMYPIMSCDSREAPDLYQTQASASGAADGCVTESKPVRTGSVACRRRMAELVRELVDSHLL